MQFDRDPPIQAPLKVAATSGLGQLVKRAQWLDSLDRLLRQSLPAPLNQQCRLANVREDRLVFLVQTPIWKAKLRLHADTLLGAAAAAGLQVRSLTVKVATAGPVPPGAPPHKPLSPAACDALRAAASATDDPQLRERLLALASMAKK
ncbi:MAG: DciA family protein [Pseudomarimonas sp.]